MPGYMGTLAAVRALGSRGVCVTVAGDGLLAPARWSRYTKKFLACPSSREPAQLIEWLFNFGDRHPGYFLYPTSDDLIWLFAQHEKELRARFRLYQPAVESQLRLLDKKQLYEVCLKARVDTVESWFPNGDDQLQKLAPTLPYPMLLKPRTQAQLSSWNKGAMAWNRAELVEKYRWCTRRDGYPAEMHRALGEHLSEPIIQRYSERAVDGIYSLAGFVDESCELLGARASVKVLQRPRRIGTGLCFESAKVIPSVSEAVVRLCKEAGYFGVFEAEFIVEGDRHMLIDFNPRFYGQMEFEHSRGLPLAYLALLGAMGEREEMRAVAAEAKRASQDEGFVYCHHVYFEMLLALRRGVGSITAAERQRWRDWYRAHEGRAVDASASTTDPKPGVIHTAAELKGALRHPAGFLRSLRE